MELTLKLDLPRHYCQLQSLSVSPTNMRHAPHCCSRDRSNDAAALSPGHTCGAKTKSSGDSVGGLQAADQDQEQRRIRTYERLLTSRGISGLPTAASLTDEKKEQRRLLDLRIAKRKAEQTRKRTTKMWRNSVSGLKVTANGEQPNRAQVTTKEWSQNEHLAQGLMVPVQSTVAPSRVKIFIDRGKKERSVFAPLPQTSVTFDGLLPMKEADLARWSQCPPDAAEHVQSCVWHSCSQSDAHCGCGHGTRVVVEGRIDHRRSFRLRLATRIPPSSEHWYHSWLQRIEVPEHPQSVPTWPKHLREAVRSQHWQLLNQQVIGHLPQHPPVLPPHHSAKAA